MNGVYCGERVLLVANQTPGGKTTSWNVSFPDRPFVKDSPASGFCRLEKTRGDGTRNLRGGYPPLTCWGARYVKRLIADGLLEVDA